MTTTVQMQAAQRAIAIGVSRLGALGRVLAPPVVRIALALPFLRSGLTRWDPFPTLSIGTQFLFETQFKLHLFGQVLDLPAPLVLAYLTAIAEIALPVLVLAGLATRVAALGLLVMTAVIQLIVPEGWVNFHLYWAGLALALIALGPGPVSLDHILARRVR
ncbi:MAG: DoxX family protein [Caulobacter sp.]|nr:DoxX family protein [Caulobacter sp.]